MSEQRFINPAEIVLRGRPLYDGDDEVYLPISDIRKSIIMTPSADVVPRSEVEALQKRVKELEAQLEKRQLPGYDESTDLALVIHQIMPVGLEVAGGIARDLLDLGYRKDTHFIKEVFSLVAKKLKTSSNYVNEEANRAYSQAVLDCLRVLGEVRDYYLGESI